MLKILLVDDHEMFRNGLKKNLESNPNFKITGEACDSQTGFEKMQRQNFDVVILDIKLPGENGINLLKRIKQLKPKMKIIVLSMYSEEVYAINAIKAGASAYLNKSYAIDKLKDAIDEVASGNLYITPDVAKHLAKQLHKKEEKIGIDRLSDRELEILCLIAEGLTTKDIAETIFLSNNTVRTYRQRILKKLQLKNDVEITNYAYREGLL